MISSNILLTTFLFITNIQHVNSVEYPSIPDPTITYGDIFKNASKNNICSVGYTKTVRRVSKGLKRYVLELYGLEETESKHYEIDHFISLELGGNNDIENLWSQSYDIIWNARVKDKLENKLRKMVCSGVITLEQAQKEISDDWIGSYCKLYDDKKKECEEYLK